MNNYSEIHSPGIADFELLRPSAVTYMPHSAEFGSRWSTYGSSSGWTSEVAATALGEHLERKHFYLDIPIHDTGPMGKTLTPEECKAFSKAFAQTSSQISIDTIENHAFDLTRAFRITDLTPCKIPSACISLTHSKNNIDNAIYPARDTCGCSVHLTLEAAILGAMKESFERQFLLRFWLTKTYREKIEYDQACELMKQSRSLPLLQQLQLSGNLSILDLTDNRFPGSCILLCYGNAQQGNVRVRYCAGMAYGDTRCTALEKSIIELWQTFRFMQFYNEKDKITDPYLRHFMNCNKYETFQRIINTRQSLPSPSPQSVTERLTAKNLIDTAKTHNINGYLYLNHIITTHKTLFFCKYISPNLFMHMNNASRINTNNHYSDAFLKDVIESQLTDMVPFP
ncbi:YcaO-like family protein [Pseudomonas alloputida]|uniref:YcaO-like family protein n=1 Tax=Pseudomonas TaxID=286 RepID=UPI003EF005BC